MSAVALQDISPRLARPLARSLNLQLSPVARPSRQITLFGKNWIDSSIIFTQRLFKFLYSLLLHCYILERYITKTFSHHTHICEKAIWCFGKQLRRDQFHISRCYGQVAESGKLKKKQVLRNLVEVGAQRTQVYWINQAWRVFCCSCIPTSFSSGLFTAWRTAERFYAEGFGFLFDSISSVVLMFASLFP